MIPTLEYDSTHRWLVVTERLGPNEWGASRIVAENVGPTHGYALVKAVDQARLTSQWCDSIGSGPIEELNEDLRLLRESLEAL